MVALLTAGCWFLIATLLGLAGVDDRLVLPGFLGFVACVGLASWLEAGARWAEAQDYRKAKDR